MTPEEKLADVERQVKAVTLGNSATFTCPYCEGETLYGNVFCCMTMARAVHAILERGAFHELAGKAERIAEYMDKVNSVIIN